MPAAKKTVVRVLRWALRQVEGPEPASSPRWFVRILAASPSSWENASDEDIDGLAKKTFAVAEEAVSVFHVESGIEEAAALTAHLCTRKSPSKDNWVLRITADDAAASKVTVDATHGGATGVEAVDSQHRDLVGDAGSFRDLTCRVLQAQLRGENRVRKISKNVVVHQLNRFLAQNGGVRVSDDTLRLARGLCKSWTPPKAPDQTKL